MPASVSGQWLGSKHHGHIDLAGQLRQPLGMTWIGESREMQGVFVGGSGDNRIDFAAEGQPGRSLDRVARYAACADDPLSVAIAFATAEPPAADRNAALRRHRVDLVLRAHHRNLCIDRLSQRAGGDLGADPARITQGDREPRT
jgi:hypothetical protein